MRGGAGTVGGVRLLPAAVILVAACAVAGCTTVSAPPPAVGRITAPPRGAPDFVTVTPPPARPLLATVQPDADKPARTTAAPKPAPAPRRRPAGTVPQRARPVRQQRPRQGTPQPRVPAGRGVCALGRVYGGWAAGSAAATICGQAYGS